MITLAIDTSSKACSAAIFKSEKLLWEGYIDNSNTHSCTLMPLIESGLSILRMSVNDVERFAVSVGPGSFTGLRIGLATVKGMAFMTEKPCISVSTLHSLAYNCLLHNGYVLAVLDARAEQVYAALFKVNNQTVECVFEDMAIYIDELKGKVPKGSLIVGDGAILVTQKIENTTLAPENVRLQRASSVGMASIKENLKQYDFNTIDLKYLRRPQAERERLSKEIIITKEI